MSVKYRRILVIGLVATVPIAALVSWSGLRARRVLVDYDSGAVKEQRVLLLFVVAEETRPPGKFASCPLPNGNRSLTGVPDWHVALSFKGDGRYSPSFESERVLREAGTLSTMFEEIDQKTASQLKLEYLSALRVGGVEAAGKLLKRAQDDWIK